MRICVAQIRPIKGDVDRNIEHHETFINLAISKEADMVFFPELSLTGYEPKLAKDLATTSADRRFDPFQAVSDRHSITLGMGMPTRSPAGVLISMILVQPHQPRQTYSKQILHADEFPYFIQGHQQVMVKAGKTVAPAICYESLQPEHAEKAFQNGAEIYVASVAKSANGVAKAVHHYSAIAKHYAMPVLMANCIGPCDDFESVGQSAIWNRNGSLLAQLDGTTEGILLYDADTDSVVG